MALILQLGSRVLVAAGGRHDDALYRNVCRSEAVVIKADYAAISPQLASNQPLLVCSADSAIYQHAVCRVLAASVVAGGVAENLAEVCRQVRLVGVAKVCSQSSERGLGVLAQMQHSFLQPVAPDHCQGRKP